MPLSGDDGDAEREREQVEGRERGVLLELGHARDQAGEQGDDEAGDQAARGHGEQVEAGEQESDRGAGQDRMRHGVAYERHAAQHQEHADGTRAERQRQRAGERTAHELELAEGGDEISWSGNIHTTSFRAFRRVLVEGLAHAARGEQVFRCQHRRRLAPGDRLAGEQQRLREMRPHEIDVVHGGKHRALLAVPALHQVEQVGRGLGIDGVERLVEHDHARILQQEAREQHALHLAARERRDGAALEAGEADGGDRLLDRCARLAVDAAEQAGAAPQPHRHHVVDVDRERAVDLGGLRQIGDILGAEPVALDAAGERLDRADDALEQRRLAGTVRTDDRHQRAGLDGAVEMMHRRMTIIAEREIAEVQCRGHEFTPSSPRSPRPRPPRSRPRRWRAAPAPTFAGSTARSTPADGPGRDGGGGAGDGCAWARVKPSAGGQAGFVTI